MKSRDSIRTITNSKLIGETSTENIRIYEQGGCGREGVLSLAVVRCDFANANRNRGPSAPVSFTAVA